MKNIISATYNQHGAISVVVEDLPEGASLTVPDDMRNMDRVDLQEWVEAGNVIGPYVPPPAAPAVLATGAVFFYDFSPPTIPPPPSGTVRLNNVTQPAVTTMWVNYLTDDAVDLKGWFKVKVEVGDVFYLQDRDEASKWQRFKVIGPAIDVATYAEVPVTWLSGGAPLTAQRLIIVRESP